MGGIGSGRRSNWSRDTVEDFRSLDINRLNRSGCLTPDWPCNWQWSRDGERVAWINMRAAPDALQLSYRHRRNGGEWQDIEERVPLVRVRCRFGGTRPYFVCPGVVNGKACGRRAVKLYGADRYFPAFSNTSNATGIP